MLARSDVATLVSTRIFCDEAGQDCQLPYIVILQQDLDFYDTIENTHGMVQSAIEITCHAAKSISVDDLTKKVHNYIRDVTGTAGTSSIKAINTDSINYSNDQPQDNSQVYTHMKTINLSILHN